MRRLLLVSDSHNSRANLDLAAQIYARENCNGLVHLGDVIEDVRYLQKKLGIAIESVAGNCDLYTSHRRSAILTIEGQRILLTHGDQYGVKWGYDRLSYAASEMGVHAALFGHTHVAFSGYIGGVLMINPGALMNGNYRILDVERAQLTPHLLRP